MCEAKLLDHLPHGTIKFTMGSDISDSNTLASDVLTAEPDDQGRIEFEVDLSSLNQNGNDVVKAEIGGLSANSRYKITYYNSDDEQVVSVLLPA